MAASRPGTQLFRASPPAPRPQPLDEEELADWRAEHANTDFFRTLLIRYRPVAFFSFYAAVMKPSPAPPVETLMTCSVPATRTMCSRGLFDYDCT
jgi:hypothetical protein